MRPDWDTYFLDIARLASHRSTCPRRAVGALLARDNIIISTGYNGSIAGMAHCSEIGCLMEHGHCVRSVHAEINAITQAARHGAITQGATLYTTASPCWACFKASVNAGVRRIVFSEWYGDPKILEASRTLGIVLVGPSPGESCELDAS
jgi:dCMP deaminase